jgi:hypothetical protein
MAAAQQLMQETEGKITERIKLLYDPMFAIVAVASLVLEFTTPAIKDDITARALLFRALRIYSQILSIYVGFDNGDFLMVTHIAGDEAAAMRRTLQTPPDTALLFSTRGICTGVFILDLPMRACRLCRPPLCRRKYRAACDRTKGQRLVGEMIRKGARSP